jgi:hypothetical protein
MSFFCRLTNGFTYAGAMRRTVWPSLAISVRPDGAVYQWRKVPPSELSVALVADERFGGATHRAEAS